jgi:hypothetical protein
MEDQVFDAEYYTESTPSNLPATLQQATVVPADTGTIQARTPFISALQVKQPRDMAVVERRILRAAALLGDDAFYGWGAGKGRVEGGTIKLANAILAIYGNAAVIPEPVQETSEAFYFTHHFVDLETNIAIARQWREGKRSKVDGNMDEERKMAIRFNRGQSKNIRNVIVHAIPEWLVNKAIEEAKGGVRAKIEKFVQEKSLAAAQKYVVDQLARVGVTEAQILAKTLRDKVDGLDVDDIVQLSGDLKSIQNRAESAAVLFPAGRAETPKLDLKDKLKAQVESAPKADPKAGKHISVRLGEEAFTFLVNDGMKEYLVADDSVALKCNCGVTKGPCAHTKAVEAYQNQS